MLADAPYVCVHIMYVIHKLCSYTYTVKSLVQFGITQDCIEVCSWYAMYVRGQLLSDSAAAGVH